MSNHYANPEILVSFNLMAFTNVLGQQLYTLQVNLLTTLEATNQAKPQIIKEVPQPEVIKAIVAEEWERIGEPGTTKPSNTTRRKKTKRSASPLDQDPT